MKCLYMRTEMDILSKVYYIIIVWRENLSKLIDNHQILQYFFLYIWRIRVFVTGSMKTLYVYVLYTSSQKQLLSTDGPINF